MYKLQLSNIITVFIYCKPDLDLMWLLDILTILQIFDLYSQEMVYNISLRDTGKTNGAITIKQ